MLGPLETIAGDVIRLAREAGASGAECSISQGEEFDAQVRKSEVETVKESGQEHVQQVASSAQDKAQEVRS